MPEESELEKVDSKEVDSEETVTEVDDTQEPVTEQSGMLCKMWSTIRRRCIILYIMWSKSLGSSKEAEIRLKETGGGILEKRR